MGHDSRAMSVSAASTSAYLTGSAATTKAQSSMEGRRLMRESKAALESRCAVLHINAAGKTKAEMTCAILQIDEEKEFFDGFSQASSAAASRDVVAEIDAQMGKLEKHLGGAKKFNALMKAEMRKDIYWK